MNGVTYWTQEFGLTPSEAEKTEAKDGTYADLIEYDPERFTDVEPYTLEQVSVSKVLYNKKGITLRWNDILCASKYQISKRIKGGKWKSLGYTNSPSYNDTDVESGTTYQYRVRARNSTETGAYSKTKSVTYIGVPTINSAKLTKTGVMLKLKKATGASQTQIWRRVMTSGGWGSWKKLAAVTGTSYTDKTVKSGKTYQYRMKSVNSSGKVINVYSNTKKITFIASPVLARPKAADKSVTLTWNKVPGAEKYRVFRKGPGDDSWIVLKDVTGLKYIDKTAKKGKEYRYSVRCISIDGTRNTSAMSAVKKIAAK